MESILPLSLPPRKCHQCTSAHIIVSAFLQTAVIFVLDHLYESKYIANKINLPICSNWTTQ